MSVLPVQEGHPAVTMDSGTGARGQHRMRAQAKVPDAVLVPLGPTAFVPKSCPDGEGWPAGAEERATVMSAFFRLMAAGPMFFVSAWLLMIFAGIVGGDVGIAPFGYVTSMVVTIGLWLVLAPAIGAVAQTRTSKHA